MKRKLKRDVAMGGPDHECPVRTEHDLNLILDALFHYHSAHTHDKITRFKCEGGWVKDENGNVARQGFPICILITTDSDWAERLWAFTQSEFPEVQ
jgi:hypothetical protein